LEWAEKSWDWTVAIGLIDDEYRIWDGTSTSNKCTDYNNLQWSYNTGVFLYGAASMWNVVSPPPFSIPSFLILHPMLTSSIIHTL